MKIVYILAVIIIIQFTYAQDSTGVGTDITEIGRVLDGYHAAAAVGDWDTYFDYNL